MEKLITYLRKAGFDAKAIEIILPHCTKKELKRGDYLLQVGTVINNLGIIESGYFMSFVSDKGIEKSTAVMAENDVIASMSSFTEDSPALENIKCISNGKIWLVSKESIQFFFSEIKGFSEFYAGLLEREIAAIGQSRHDLITLNTQQHYEKIVKQQPKLIQNVPLKYVASVLGITPRHLSRIRALKC